MPTYKVTDPATGRTLRLTGDSPPTQQELEGIFAQYQADDQPVIRENVMTQSPTNLRQQAVEELVRETGPLEAEAVAFGRGLTTVGRGLGIADPEQEAERRAFEALQRSRPTTIVSEVAGEAAPFVVAGTPIGAATTIPARAALSGALGAAEGAILTRGMGGTGEESIIGAGIGGTIAAGAEVALPVVGRVGGRIIRQVTGKAPSTPVLDAAGNPSAELQNAMDKAGIGIDDLKRESARMIDAGEVSDPAALLRKEFLEEQGLTPTRAQVTGAKTDFQTQQELAKTSGRIDDALREQEQILGDKFENAISATGGSANPSKSPVFDYVADRSIEQDAAIGEAYRSARELAPTDAIVRPDNLVQSMKSIAGSETATGGIVGATRDILKQKGVLGNKGLKIKGRVTPQVAEEIRQDMNSLFDSLTPRGRMALKDFKDAIDKDVSAAVGDDVFAEARAAKAKFESDLRRSKTNKFDRRNKDLIRDILENKIDPDKFLDEAVLRKSVRADDILDLKKYLSLDGDAGAGAAAWNDLRAEAMERIRNDAFNEVGGELAITRASLERSLDKFGDQKLKALFNPDEIKFLDDMVKVTKIREPKRGTQQGLGPTAQAVLKLESVIKRIPLVNDAFQGLAVDRLGKVVIRPPSLQAPLKPTDASQFIAPAAAPIAAGIATQEQ